MGQVREKRRRLAQCCSNVWPNTIQSWKVSFQIVLLQSTRVNDRFQAQNLLKVVFKGHLNVQKILFIAFVLENILSCHLYRVHAMCPLFENCNARICAELKPVHILSAPELVSSKSNIIREASSVAAAKRFFNFNKTT